MLMVVGLVDTYVDVDQTQNHQHVSCIQAILLIVSTQNI